MDATIDPAIVLARMLRTVDRIVADVKDVERDRETLRRLTTDDRREGRTDA